MEMLQRIVEQNENIKALKLQNADLLAKVKLKDHIDSEEKMALLLV